MMLTFSELHLWLVIANQSDAVKRCQHAELSLARLQVNILKVTKWVYALNVSSILPLSRVKAARLPHIR